MSHAEQLAMSLRETLLRGVCADPNNLKTAQPKRWRIKRHGQTAETVEAWRRFAGKNAIMAADRACT